MRHVGLGEFGAEVGQRGERFHAKTVGFLQVGDCELRVQQLQEGLAVF